MARAFGTSDLGLSTRVNFFPNSEQGYDRRVGKSDMGFSG